ncbi:MAG: dCMP hydroxymethylase [Spirochaetes bacterium]|nr:dCMP hydroxymethylase [Spirochaetota bacterium]
MTNEKTVFIEVIDPLYRKLKEKDFVIDKTGCKIVELIAPRFSLNPAEPFLDFGKARKTPKKYVKAETDWYDSKSLSVDKIGKCAKTWLDIASSSGEINSNYGWCIYSQENYNQFYNCLKELQHNQESRRAVMIYNRPSMWYDYNKEGMNDFMCTFATQHFIRNGALISIVNMRSNDFVYGFFNDFFWQATVHERLRQHLARFNPVKIGEIIWLANSLHVYEHHFIMLEKLYYYSRGVYG